MVPSAATVLEGDWTGSESEGPDGEWTLVVRGDRCTVRGARLEEWYEGTFALDATRDPARLSLRIDAAGQERLIGRVAPSGSVFDGRERQGLWYIVLANVPTLLVGLFIERFLWSTVTRRSRLWRNR